MDWFDKEAEALDDQLARGEITIEEHRREMRLMVQDAKEQEDREDIIAAGRGHLLRDY
jgi:hypothetical protein